MIAEYVDDLIATPERKGISTTDAVGFLMAAMKAQQRQIEALQAQVDAL